MAGRGLARLAPVLNLGTRAVGWGKNLITGGRTSRIADRTDEIMESFQRMPELEGLDHAELVRRATRMATSEVGPGFIRRFGLKIGIGTAGTYAAANAAGNIAENGIIDGAAETLSDVNDAFSAAVHPFDTLERTAQRRAANVEAVQAVIAGLEAQVAGQTPMLTFLGILQSFFPNSEMIQGWIDSRQDRISSLREQMQRAGTGGYGDDSTSGGTTLPVAETAITAGTGYGLWRAGKWALNKIRGGGNDGGGNNTPDRPNGFHTGSADAPAARTARTRTPHIGGNRLMRRFGGLLRLKKALLGASVVTAGVVGAANASEAQEEYTTGDIAVDVASIAVPVVADIADVVELTSRGEFREAAEVGAVAAGGALTAAFASAGAGALMGTFVPGAGNIIGGIVGFGAGLGGYYLGSTGISRLFNSAANPAEPAPVQRVAFTNTGPSALFG